MRSALIVVIILLAFVWSNSTKQVKADPVGSERAVKEDKDDAQRFGTSAVSDIDNVGADDKVITETIQKFLATDKDISLATEKITVTVFNGFVTLKGVVKDKEEKDAIEQKAASIEYVRKVDNQLAIEH